MTTYFTDSDDKAKKFSDNLQTIIKEFTLSKVVSHNMAYKFYYTDQLENLGIDKIKEYKLATINNTECAWANYKKARNVYKNKLNSVKNSYISNKIDNSYNSKNMWSNIKTYVLKKPKN